MTTVKDVLGRLNSFNIDETLEQIVFDLREEIIALNTKKQLLEKGIDTEGRLIGVYSPATEQLSGGRKKAGGHYTLFDTGELFRSWSLQYRKGSVIFFATDNKLSEVFATIKRHGLIQDPERIFGLTVEHDRTFNFELMLPQFRKRFKNDTGL